MQSLIIRPIEDSDVEAIAQMIARLADHVRPGFVPLANVENLKRYGPLGAGLFECLIAHRDGYPVGLCLYTYLFSGWRGKPGIFINDLYVETSGRGTGLGKSLLKAVIERESDKGCSFIKLEVDKDNMTGQGFYQRLGFEKDTHDDVMTIEIAAFRA